MKMNVITINKDPGLPQEIEWMTEGQTDMKIVINDIIPVIIELKMNVVKMIEDINAGALTQVVSLDRNHIMGSLLHEVIMKVGEGAHKMKGVQITIKQEEVAKITRAVAAEAVREVKETTTIECCVKAKITDMMIKAFA